MRLLVVFVLIGVLCMPVLALGQVGEGGVTPGLSIKNPLKFDTIDAFITAILEVVVDIMVPIVALAIIYSGFLFVTAGGDTGKLQTARETFFWTVIGAGVTLGAFVIQKAIQGTVGQLRSSYETLFLTAYAEGLDPNNFSALPGGEPGTVGNLIYRFIQNVAYPLVVLSFSVALVIFLWGLVLYLRDEDKSKARPFIIWGIVIMAVMTATWGLVNVVVATFFDAGSLGAPTIPSIN